MNFDVEQIPTGHVLQASRWIGRTAANRADHQYGRKWPPECGTLQCVQLLVHRPADHWRGCDQPTYEPSVPKDTARNIRRTGEFVVSAVTEDIAEKMNICATDLPPEMSEVEFAGFTTTPSLK